MLTPKEIAQFTALEQCMLRSFPIFVQYLLTCQNEYKDRLMTEASDAFVLVMDTFFELRQAGIWQNYAFASDTHAFRYFRKCLKNAVLQLYRSEHRRFGDPQERQKERVQHINRTRTSRSTELLPALAEGEQFIMPQRLLTAHIPVTPTYVERPWFTMAFQELEACLIAQGLAKEWTLLKCKYAYGWSNQRIAQHLGYSSDSVRSLAPRYLARIRQVAEAAGLFTLLTTVTDERREWERLNNLSQRQAFRVKKFLR